MLTRSGHGGMDTADDNANFYSYNKKSKMAEASNRASFIPPSTSPGPAAYTPLQQSTKESAPRGVFGTANRAHEDKRYVSEMHNRSIPVADTPGPGTYRVAKSERHARHPMHSFTPSWHFGSAAQRLDPDTFPAASIPGPIYDHELPKDAPAYSFAPGGSFEQGTMRHRNDDSKMYLSKEHFKVDPTTLANNFSVGPGQYDTPSADVLSPKRKGARAVFGKMHRDAKASLTEEALKVEPLSGYPAKTPGAIYEYPSTLDKHSNKFGKGSKVFMHETGSSTAGPYIGKGHERIMRGTQSPGPGMYDIQGGRNKAVGGLGDGPTYPFGVLPYDGDGTSMNRMKVPGPGAYSPQRDKASGVPTGASYSVASCLRTDFTDFAPRNVPGPGAYNVADASRSEGKKPKAPSFSLGAQDKDGRTSFIADTCTPGPCYAPKTGNVDASVGKGYSFGLKEKTRDVKSTIGVRYHGPLAANETLGTASPGPVYDVTSGVAHLSGKHEMPHLKFATSTRDKGSRIYISRQHAEAEGMGIDSPGPGAYDHHDKELAVVTSRFRKTGNTVFPSSERFKMNFNTF